MKALFPYHNSRQREFTGSSTAFKASTILLMPNKTFFAKILLLLVCIYSSQRSLGQFQGVAISNPIATSPANQILRQYISSGAVTSNLTFNPSFGVSEVKLFGQIKRISPDPFTVELRPDYVAQTPIGFAIGSIPINSTQMAQAFGNFSPSNLVSTDIPLSAVTDPSTNEIVLPDGIYNICFYAKEYKGNCPNPSGCIVSNTACSNSFTIACSPVNSMQINTIAKAPLNPFVAQAISLGGVSATVQLNKPPGCSQQTLIKIFGKIERVSPAPFTISTSPNYQQQGSVPVNSGITQLTPNQQLQAFAQFNASNLIVSGIDLASIRDATNNIKLPDGNYRICYYARYVTANGTLGGNASNPNLGCGNFTICQAASAPQFIQPVNNLSINSLISIVRPTSPVAFTWTPPLSTCGLPPGGYLYDFEIREIMDNQGMLDAVNNPFVFRKTGLPVTTFLLDTNLYKNVLQQGRKYIIRVRATSIATSSPLEIDNNGFSRVEAFQYGENAGTMPVTPMGALDPLLTYLLFEERKTNFWDDQFTAYESRTRSDTLVPIREYIAFNLMKNGTAYSLDAIELFYLLNPDLINEKAVSLSHRPNLPVLPKVPETDQRKFNDQHANNLLSDGKESNRFKTYSDSLTSLNARRKVPVKAEAMIGVLINQLNDFNKDINSADKISVSTINALLSELLFDLKLYAKSLKEGDYNHLQSIVSDLLELTTPTDNNAALLYPSHENKAPSINYTVTNAVYRYGEKTAHLNHAKNSIRNAYEEYLFAALDRILPFDVVVYRAKTPPAGPVLTSPDLTAAYRILYTLSSLYNNKNPEINAKGPTELASTVQVSLPQTLGFKFWTINMLNHKRTNPDTVDVKDVFQNNRKKPVEQKKLSIVLKVD